MRSSQYFFLSVFVLVVIVPLLRFYTVTPDLNACMIEYVDTLEQNNFKGYMYQFDGQNHIEPSMSPLNSSLVEHKVGYSTGCVMTSGNLFRDFNNTVYCSVTYMIRESPMPESLKEPIAF